MADTPDSKSGAERREGSNPSPRTCHCGMTVEDYMHYGWHRIHEWNTMVFADGKAKAEREFDALLNQRESARRKKMPPVPTGDPALWEK
jgi:hypothetical protein